MDPDDSDELDTAVEGGLAIPDSENDVARVASPYLPPFRSVKLVIVNGTSLDGVVGVAVLRLLKLGIVKGASFD